MERYGEEDRTGQIVLGMRRLGIIDLLGGMQPIESDGLSCRILHSARSFSLTIATRIGSSSRLRSRRSQQTPAYLAH